MKAKKVGLSCLSLFLFYQSVQLTIALSAYSEPYSWLTALSIGVIVNLFITGTFAFAGFAFPSSKLLPESFYSNLYPNRIKKLYQYLGGKYFRTFLLQTFWKKQKQRARYFEGGKAGLDKMYYESKQAEFGHLVPFFLISLIGLLFAYQLQWKALLICQTINIIFNFYPILLQRFLRIRLFLLKNRLK